VSCVPFASCTTGRCFCSACSRCPSLLSVWLCPGRRVALAMPDHLIMSSTLAMCPAYVVSMSRLLFFVVPGICRDVKPGSQILSNVACPSAWSKCLCIVCTNAAFIRACFCVITAPVAITCSPFDLADLSITR
jgi:hypothetical protein